MTWASNRSVWLNGAPMVPMVDTFLKDTTVEFMHDLFDGDRVVVVYEGLMHCISIGGKVSARTPIDYINGRLVAEDGPGEHAGAHEAKDEPRYPDEFIEAYKRLWCTMDAPVKTAMIDWLCGGELIDRADQGRTGNIYGTYAGTSSDALREMRDQRRHRREIQGGTP